MSLFRLTRSVESDIFDTCRIRYMSNTKMQLGGEKDEKGN